MKDKILSALIIIAVLCGGGYYLYDKFTYEGNSIVDADVEPAVIGSYYIGNAFVLEFDDENKDILERMEQSDANYFGAEAYADGYYNLSQLPKSDYDVIKENIVYKNCDAKGMDKARDYLLKLFNMSYEDVKEIDESRTIYNTSLLDNLFKEYEVFNIQEELKNYFYGNIDDVFVDNEVVLKCDDVQFTKICLVYAEDGYDCDDINHSNYMYLIGNASVNVKTKDYEETRNVKIKTLISIFDGQPSKISFHAIKLQ